jgi:hypothetical protein
MISARDVFREHTPAPLSSSAKRGIQDIVLATNLLG